MHDDDFGCLATIVYIVVTTWSVDFLGHTLLHQGIPIIGSMVIGFIFGSLTVPFAIIVLLLGLCGIAF